MHAFSNLQHLKSKKHIQKSLVSYSGKSKFSFDDINFEGKIKMQFAKFHLEAK